MQETEEINHEEVIKNHETMKEIRQNNKEHLTGTRKYKLPMFEAAEILSVREMHFEEISLTLPEFIPKYLQNLLKVVFMIHSQSFLAARIQKMGKVLFWQVSVCPHGESTPVPGSFPGLWPQTFLRDTIPRFFSDLWSQVLSGDTPVPGSFPGPRYFPAGTPSPRWGYPQPGQDWDTSTASNRVPPPPTARTMVCPQPELGYPLVRTKVLPPPSTQNSRIAEQLLATRQRYASSGHTGGLSIFGLCFP